MMESESPYSSAEDSSRDATLLDGSWERKGRSTNAAAAFALLLVGGIYANGAAILSVVAFVIGGIDVGETASTATYLEKLAANAEASKNPIRISLTIAQYMLMLLPTVWIVRSWHSSTVRRYMRFSVGSVKDIVLGIAAALCFFPANIAISNYFVCLLGIPDTLVEINSSLFTAHTGAEFLWLVFVVCGTPALCEEVFFRGCVQRTFERSMGWKAVLLTGFLFGLYHLQPLGLFTLSGLGFLIGLFYHVSGALLPAMAVHFTNNFLVTLILYVPKSVGGIRLSGSDTLPWWMVISSVALLIMVLYAFIKSHVRIAGPPENALSQ